MVQRVRIEMSNTCNGASVARRATTPSKGTTVFTLLAILGIISIVGVAGTIATSARDGYGRRPTATIARTV